MTQKTNFFKLGLFIIIAVGLGAVFLIIFGAGKFFKHELLVETCFNESVQGLNIGSEVKYKGIKIGTVKSITSAARVYQTQSDYVLVIIALEDGVCLGQTGDSTTIRIRKAIENGLVIRLSFKGLTGVAYLETDYSVQTPDDALDIPWTPENIYIPSQESNIKQLGDTLNLILDNLADINLKGITTNIDGLLKTLDQKANEVDMKNISGLTASLLAELKDTNRKISTTIGSDKVKHLLEDAHTSFSELRTIVETSKTPLNQALTDFQKAAGSTKNMTRDLEARLAPKIESLSSSLDQLMQNLAGTSERVENIIWFNSDKIKLIIDNLEATSENLKQMSHDLKRYPGRLLFEKPPQKINTEEKN